MPLPSQRADSDGDNAMPSLDADEKSWETWAFAEQRAFRPAERLNAAGQLEEFVQTTFGQWSVHGGSVDEYAWRVVSERELTRRKAEAEQKAAEGETDPQPAAAVAQIPRTSRIEWQKLAGTPSAELFNHSLVAHARASCLTGSKTVQLKTSDEALMLALCNSGNINDINSATLRQWRGLCEEGENDYVQYMYGAPKPFYRSQPLLRRNVRQIKAMIDNQRERGDEISPKYIKLSYHTEVTPRAIRVVKRGKAAAALNYTDTEATPLFDDSDTAERWRTNADDGRRHRRKQRIPSSSRKGVGRHDPPLKSHLERHTGNAVNDQGDTWSYGQGTGLGGVGTTPHTHADDLDLYPNSRFRRVHVDTADSWLERDAGPHDQEESEDDWRRYRGIDMNSARLPTVRLGMRKAPDDKDWKRFWTAVADEGTLVADARATRRKERRRLQKEYELALSGRKETKSGKKAIPKDMVKAARLKHQLDHWYDVDPEQGHEATRLWGSTGSEDVEATAADHSSEEQHSDSNGATGSTARETAAGSTDATTTATQTTSGATGEDELPPGQQRLQVRVSFGGGPLPLPETRRSRAHRRKQLRPKSRSQESEQLETSAASDERAGEVAQTRTESTESQPDDDDDISAASAAFEDDSNNIGVQERQELFNEGVALGFQLGYAAALDQATSSEAAATTSQRQTGNLVEDTLQSPGALTGRRVPLYERSGEGKRASASGLVETSASAELAQSDGDPLGGDLGEDAGPARLDGDES
jgi:hypothetical protein